MLQRFGRNRCLQRRLSVEPDANEFSSAFGRTERQFRTQDAYVRRKGSFIGGENDFPERMFRLMKISILFVSFFKMSLGLLFHSVPWRFVL